MNVINDERGVMLLQSYTKKNVKFSNRCHWKWKTVQFKLTTIMSEQKK